MTARELHELLADVVGVRRHTLLVEEVSLHPVRVANHVEKPPAQMRQCEGGDVEVVPDDVALGEATLWEEELVRVGERDLVVADTHGSESCRGGNSPTRRSIALNPRA